MQRGYKYEELYDMTLKELRNTQENINKGLAYMLFKNSILIVQAVAGKNKRTAEEACPELYPPKKTYKMPEWLRKRYYDKKKGVK